jgi:hypothetical protein
MALSVLHAAARTMTVAEVANSGTINLAQATLNKFVPTSSPSILNRRYEFCGNVNGNWLRTGKNASAVIFTAVKYFGIYLH